MWERGIVPEIQIRSNLGGRDRSGDLNSLEFERKRSHGNIQICSKMGGGNSAGYSAAGERVDAGDWCRGRI